MYRYPFSREGDSFDLSTDFGFPQRMPDRILVPFLSCLHENRDDFFDFLDSNGELVAYSPVELAYFGTMARPGSPARAFGTELLEQNVGSRKSDFGWSQVYFSVVQMLGDISTSKLAYRGSRDTRERSYFRQSVKPLETLELDEVIVSLEVTDSFGHELQFDDPPASLDIWPDLPKDHNQGFSATVCIKDGNELRDETFQFFCPAQTIDSIGHLELTPQTVVPILKIAMEAGVPEVALAKLEGLPTDNLFAQGVIQALKETLELGGTRFD